MIDTKREAAIDDIPAGRGRSGSAQGNNGSRLLMAGAPFAVAAGLLAVVLFLYGGVLWGWWRWDDSSHLVFVVRQSPWQYFIVPEVWQQISASNLTPWLSLGYDADLWLFGLQPGAYYAHHLASLWLAAVLTYLLLRLWLRPLWSLLGAVLFLVGAPVAIMAQQVMSRHYIEGLVFAIAALYCYVLSLRRDSMGWSWLGAAFYLLAVTAKEVYAPLIAFLPFLAESSFGQRLRKAAPFALVVAAYIPWRWHMLGVPVGGYATTYDPATLIADFARIPQLLFGDTVWGTLAILALTFVVVMAIALRCLRPAASLVAVLLVLAPLVPLTVVPGIVVPDRYLFLPWWLLSCAAALLLSRLSRPRSDMTLACATIYGLIAGVAWYQAWHTLSEKRPHIDEMEVQGRFVWEGDGSRAIMLSPAMAASFWEFGDLINLKRELAANAEFPKPIVDEIQLANIDTDRLPIWRYDPQCACTKDITSEVPSILADWNARRVQRPLSVLGTYRDYVVTWHLGPYGDGRYRIVGETIGGVPVPREGQRRGNVNFGVFFIRYDSPEGWITYSDLLTLPSDGSELVWQR